MENEVIQSWLKEVSSQIPQFFLNDKKLKDNLMNFVIFDEFEWFNIALLYYQNPNATFVMEKTEWIKLVGEEKFFINKGSKGLRVLLPSIENNSFSWKAVVVWDIKQLTDIDYEHFSNLKLYSERINVELYEDVKKSDEIMNYVMNYCTRHLVIPENIDLKYVSECILYVLSHYFIFNFRERPLARDDLSDTECLQYYVLLCSIVKELPVILENYFNDLLARYKEEQQIEKAREYVDLNIRERIAQAEIQLNDSKTKERQVTNNAV